MRIRQREKIAFLLLCDLLAMLIAFIIALALGHRSFFYFALLFYYRWGIIALFAAVIILFIILDVYSLHRMPIRFVNQLLMIGVGLFISSVIGTFMFFFFREPVPRAVFILFYLFAWVLIGTFRFVYSKKTLSLIYHRMLLVGEPDLCTEISSLIGERKYLHTQVVGCLMDGLHKDITGNIPCLGKTEDLISCVVRENIDQVVVAIPSVKPALMKALMDCMKHKLKVSDYKQIIEEVTGKIPIEYLSPNWFIEELSSLEKRYTWYYKRAFDILVSVVGGLFAVPLLLIAAFVIKFDSRGAIFYSQIRIGRGSRPFRVWKLRTMVADADKNNVFWTNDNDDRITRVGGFLRKMHIDELPQFLNILKGDMSLIGPRPEAAALVEMYTKVIPFYQERHMVTPGVTGWAQINYPYGNSVEDTREKLKYDFYYIKNRSLLLDLLICLRTIRTVFTGKGAI
jgi:exopolysaccharide biosynthesis polyprenyl glycosylphosphotransferase